MTPLRHTSSNTSPGLPEYHAAQHEAFRQLEEDAWARHPDPTPEDIAAAEAAEAALPSRKRTEVQLRRSFAPLAYQSALQYVCNSLALQAKIEEARSKRKNRWAFWR